MLQEDGVATAIESIYRDLEYARSLIKRTSSDDSENGEDATIRDHSRRHSAQGTPDRRRSGYSAPSEDWSVIDQDDRRSSLNSQNSDKPERYKRNSLAAAVLSVLPDALTPSPLQRRASSTSSHS
jgi:sterol 3beta-glucosyltransferase